MSIRKFYCNPPIFLVQSHKRPFGLMRIPPTAVGGIKSDKIKPEGVYLGFYTAHGHRCDFCEAIECRCPCVPLIWKGRRPFQMNAERYT